MSGVVKQLRVVYGWQHQSRNEQQRAGNMSLRVCGNIELCLGSSAEATQG